MKSSPFLIRRYNHDDILLSVSGVRDEDGCEIGRITAADSTIDITELFSVPNLEAIAHNIDMRLSREDEEHNREARAERNQWYREFAIV